MRVILSGNANSLIFIENISEFWHIGKRKHESYDLGSQVFGSLQALDSYINYFILIEIFIIKRNIYYFFQYEEQKNVRVNLTNDGLLFGN